MNVIKLQYSYKIMLFPFISLEKELENRSKNNVDAERLWNRYKSVKDYLSDNYYRWVLNECPYFTDHGEQHIESVIQAASALVQPHLGQDQSVLSPLDIFLILSGVLWYDVGNVYGRSGHADKVTAMTAKIKELGFPFEILTFHIILLSGKLKSGNC